LGWVSEDDANKFNGLWMISIIYLKLVATLELSLDWVMQLNTRAP
jgi:hypothetical protein